MTNYVLTSQTIFLVWLSTESGEMKLGAEIDRIFSLKFCGEYVPRSFKMS